VRLALSSFEPCASFADLESLLDLQDASDFFPEETAHARISELKAWLNEKGAKDFEKVPLFSEQLEKVLFCVISVRR
jgi:hypothetical protein